MKSILGIRLPVALVCLVAVSASTDTKVQAEDTGTVILDDDFNREESDPAIEEVGHGWSTNSKSRAQGVKQVDLSEGAMHIFRADVADHGVSVVHEIGFQDGSVACRFRLGKNDDLGINIADMKEKSVHAGHICMVRIKPRRVEIIDMKTGRMALETRKARLAGTLSDAEKARIKTTSKAFKVDIESDQWHDLKVQITGQTMSVAIDGHQIGEFQSEGIGHPTKQRLRLAVNKSAWVDDLKVIRDK